MKARSWITTVSTFFVALVLVCLGSCDWINGGDDEPPFGSISGVVRDADTDQPIANALVTVKSLGANNTTKAGGEYEFKGLTENTYTLRAEKECYQTQEKPIVVTRGRDSELNFELTPIAPVLSVSPTNLDFGASITTLSFEVTNAGSGTLEWAITENIPWLEVNPTSGSQECTVAGKTETVPSTPMKLPERGTPPDLKDHGPEDEQGHLADKATFRSQGNPVLLHHPSDSLTSISGRSTVTVTVDRMNLSAGTYTGTIVVGSDHGRAEINVTVQVPGPVIGSDKTDLDFGEQETQQSFTLSNSTGVGTLSYTIDADADWITISPNSGTLSTETEIIMVTVDRSTLAPGTYNQLIVVNAGDAGTLNIDVRVVVVDPNEPQLDVSQTQLDFGNITTALSLQVLNIGGGTLTWSASTSQSWLSLSQTSGSTTPEVPTPLTVSVDRSELSPDSYADRISFSSNGGTINVDVTMTVSADPILVFTPDTLDFGENLTQLSFTISNVGTGDLNWTLSTNQNWLTANPPSGTNQTTVNVDVTRSDLAFGEYSGEVTISSNGGEGKVIVFMGVPNQLPTADFTVSPQSGDLQTVFMVDASGSTDPEDPTAALEVRWRWEAGEAFTNWTTSKIESHQYNSSGMKTITLEVRDTQGADDATTRTVNVEQDEPTLIAYYPFNGNTDDESSNGNDGVVCSSPRDPSLTTDRFGNENSAYFFDGDDCINLGNRELIGPRFSISVWAKPMDFSHWNTIINKFRDVSSLELHGSYLGISTLDATSPGQTIRMTIGSSGLLNFNFAEGGAIGVDEWVHIAVTYDQSRINVYQNAVLKATEFTTRTREITPVDMLIGLESANLIDGFEGEIDDLRIYDGAISEELIEELFREGGWAGN